LTSATVNVKLPNPLTLSDKKQTRPIFERAGAWLFKHRTSLPVPLVLALLIIPAAIAGGEALRLWAVRHIGVISRTRSDRLGPLVETGPFAWIRNPLYIGNLALWVGFTLGAQLVPLVPLVIIVLGIEYHAIVRWEESMLESRRGDEYRAYAARVPRWIPRIGSRQSPAIIHDREPYSWGDTLFSERGTLIAIAAGSLLLWLKSRA
jgi:protein-S-isoprenylcysteine O-methyltransferase Ste14